MATELDIWNIALGRVGEAHAIQDRAEGSTAARACLRFWPTVIDATLERFDWPFARRLATAVGVSGTTPSPLPFIYAWPIDCLALRRVVRANPPELPPDDGEPVQWDLALLVDAAGLQETRVVVTAEPVALLAYTRRVRNVTLWSPQAADALAWRLAAELAMIMPESRSLRSDAYSAWEAVIREAEVSSARQRHRPLPESALIRARA